jgi:hypothetical protein
MVLMAGEWVPPVRPLLSGYHIVVNKIKLPQKKAKLGVEGSVS